MYDIPQSLSHVLEGYSDLKRYSHLNKIWTERGKWSKILGYRRAGSQFVVSPPCSGYTKSVRKLILSEREREREREQNRDSK